MSDDRFKDARRSLIDRQGEQEGEEREEDSTEEGADEFADAQTELVDLDAPAEEEAETAPDAPTTKVDRSDIPTGEEDVPTAGWELGDGVESEADFGADADSQDDFDSIFDEGHAPPPAEDPSVFDEKTRLDETTNPLTESGESAHGGAGASEPHDDPAFVDMESLVGGSDHGTRTAPGREGRGEEVSGQQARSGATGPTDRADVFDDPVLRRNYEFEREGVGRGDIPLVCAMNPAGKPVVLRQVWTSDIQEMPQRLRRRLNRLEQIEAPHLLEMNGMLVTETGAWLEFDRPVGRRMSDILTEDGPQEAERILPWIRAAGEAISHVHEHGFVYANLTPRALWIDDNDDVLLEPFDVMRFEDHGNLGQFGPPEMNLPPERRELSPATDVYSLAALMLAGLTGIPLQPERVASIESDRITAVVRDAVVEDPRDRIQSVENFLERLRGGLFTQLREVEFNFETAGLAATGVAMFLLVLTALVQGGDPSGSGTETDGTSPGPNSAATQPKTPEATAIAPGPVEQDGRVFEITTGYRFNPPADAHAAPPGPEREKRLDALRQKARSRIEAASKLEGKKREKALEEALRATTTVIRLQEEGGTRADRQLLEQIRENASILSLHRKLVDRVEERFEAGELAEAEEAYRRLHAIDPEAESVTFFEQRKKLRVERVGSSSEDEDSREGEAP